MELRADVKALKEKDGSPLGEKVFNATKAGTISTVSYNFPKPGTTEPGNASSATAVSSTSPTRAGP